MVRITTLSHFSVNDLLTHHTFWFKVYFHHILLFNINDTYEQKKYDGLQYDSLFGTSWMHEDFLKVCISKLIC